MSQEAPEHISSFSRPGSILLPGVPKICTASFVPTSFWLTWR